MTHAGETLVVMHDPDDGCIAPYATCLSLGERGVCRLQLNLGRRPVYVSSVSEESAEWNDYAITAPPWCPRREFGEVVLTRSRKIQRPSTEEPNG